MHVWTMLPAALRLSRRANVDPSLTAAPNADGRVDEPGTDDVDEKSAPAVDQFAEAVQEIVALAGELGESVRESRAGAQDVSMAVRNMAGCVERTADNARSVCEGVFALNEALDGIARGAVHQTAQAHEVSATAAQMACSVERVADEVRRVSDVGAQMRAGAESVARAVNSTTARMEEIHSAVGQAEAATQDLSQISGRIGTIAETIDDIAEQTNLLALNAAIEAARAGQHGRGFAVVADEVRKLAERSKRETKQIAELVRQVRASTDLVVKAVGLGAEKVTEGRLQAGQAYDALDAILSAIDHTAQEVAGIAATADGLSSDVRSVSDGMHSMTESIERSTQTVQEMAQQANRVTETVQAITSLSAEHAASTTWARESAELTKQHVKVSTNQAQELAAAANRLLVVLTSSEGDAVGDDVLPDAA